MKEVCKQHILVRVSRGGRDMQREIDELKKKLRRAWRSRSSPDSESSSEETDGTTYSEDPELHPVKLSLAKRNIAISVRIRA